MLENYFGEEQSRNRDYVISLENELFEIAKKEKGKTWLHLGCGDRVLDGFVNVDKYYKAPNVQNYDIYKLPYKDDSVDLIYCSHVLEHLPYRHARLAVKEWGRVLKRGEKLFLAIPNMELIMVKLLDSTLSRETWEWYLYTLFGFQTDPSNTDPNKLDYEIAPGHFHTCGFTKKTISQELREAGLRILEIFDFDGWGTPSIWATASKI